MAETPSVLLRPLITERTTRLREIHQFVFEVKADATKGQIRREVEARYKVTVLKVQTGRVPGKYRRRAGPVGGYQPEWKKAIIKLKEGQQITWEEVS